MPKTDLPEITRTAPLGKGALDEKARTATLAFSSESPIRDYSYLPPVILLHEPGAVDLQVIRDLGALLLNHDVSQILGAIQTAELSPVERVCRATVVFDRDEQGERAWQKVKSGSLRGVSVRYKPLEVRELEEGESWTSPGGKGHAGPVVIVTKWEVREISLTPLPADTAVGVGRTLGKEVEMPEWLLKTLKERGISIPDNPTDDQIRDLVTQALQDPSSPGKQTGAARELGQIAERTGLQELLPGWIERDITPDVARKEALEKLADAVPTTSNISVERDSRDRFKDAHTAGLLQRTGFYRPDDPDFKGVTPERTSLLDLAKRSLQRVGVSTSGPMDSMISRAVSHSVSDFPYLLENVLNKAIQVQYQEADSTFQRWCTVRDSYTLERAESRIIASEAPDLLETPEHMGVKEGSFSDGKQEITTRTYARRFSITRQAIVNDDLSFFETVGRALAMAGRRLPNDLVYDLLALNSGAGPAMRDSNNLFDSSNHGNVGTAGALAIGTLGEARKLLRLQTGPNGAVLNIPARVLLVPAALETTAEQLVSDLVIPNAAANLSTDFIRNLEVVADARLDAISATGYYLMAGSAYPIIEVDFLDGKRTPILIREEYSNVLGVSWTAILDVGAGALDWRGAVRNAGA